MPRYLSPYAVALLWILGPLISHDDMYGTDCVNTLQVVMRFER